jgi:hypothetical protein
LLLGVLEGPASAIASSPSSYSSRAAARLLPGLIFRRFINDAFARYMKRSSWRFGLALLLSFSTAKPMGLTSSNIRSLSSSRRWA